MLILYVNYSNRSGESNTHNWWQTSGYGLSKAIIIPRGDGWVGECFDNQLR